MIASGLGAAVGLIGGCYIMFTTGVGSVIWENPRAISTTELVLDGLIVILAIAVGSTFATHLRASAIDDQAQKDTAAQLNAAETDVHFVVRQKRGPK